MEYSNTLKLHENEVVHCHTEKEAIEVLEIAHNLGYKWHTGISFIDDTCFYRYREKTCYLITSGQYCEISYCESIGKSIISAEEFIGRHEQRKLNVIENALKKGFKITDKYCRIEQAEEFLLNEAKVDGFCFLSKDNIRQKHINNNSLLRFVFDGNGAMQLADKSMNIDIYDDAFILLDKIVDQNGLVIRQYC